MALFNKNDFFTKVKDSAANVANKVKETAENAKNAYAEKKELEARLKKDGLEHIFYDIEMPLAKTLAKTEHEGFLLDTDGIAAYGKVLEKRLSERKCRAENVFLMTVSDEGQINIILKEEK